MSPSYQRVKWGEKELPIPVWALHALWISLLLGLIAAGVWWISEQLNADLASISPAERFQMAESQRHFAEAPSVEFTAYDDARGALRLRVYASDGCIGTIRRLGATGPNQVQWLGDPSRATPPPLAAQLPADITLSSAVYAGGQPEEIHCACNFEGDFVQQDGERYGEWLRIYRQYRHGCQLWWMRNTVYNFDESDSEGRPVLHFTACAHR